MNFPERFLIEGNVYSMNDLVALCKKKLESVEVSEWEKEIYGFIHDFLDHSATIQQYTSGTTRQAKGMNLRRSSMLESAGKTIKYFNLQKSDKILLCLPIRYIAGKMMVVRALLGELDLHYLKPTGDPYSKLNYQVKFAAMVPLQVHNGLESRKNFSKIEKLLIGGGEIHAALRDRLVVQGKCEAYESFGMTETYSHFALREINSVSTGSTSLNTFNTLPGTLIDLDDRGCLTVDIPGITIDRVVTNDLVEILSETTFQWLGRIDNIINTGGVKIIPEALESRINNILGIEVLLAGVPDDQLGQKLILIAEDGQMKPEVMYEKLSENLQQAEKPREIYTVDQFQRNESYKIDRKKVMEKIFWG